MRVPDSPSDLDTAWVQAALQGVSEFEGTRVSAVDARIIGVGYGLDGTLAHLAIAADGGPAGRPDSLVVKLSPFPRGQAEVDFYERVAPHMPVRLPRCYRGIVSGADERAALLLEDLTSAVQGDCIAGASLAQAEAVLRATARYHAAFLGGEHPATSRLGRWGPDVPGLASKLEDRLPRFLERYGEQVHPGLLASLPELPARLAALVECLGACQVTLVHTDLHLDNVLFLPDGEPVILDWPDARLGPSLLDVARLFVEGIRLDMRRRHGAGLFEVYRRARAEAGAPCAPSDETQRAFEAALRLQFAHAASWAGAEEPGFETPRVRQIVENLLRNASAAVADIEAWS